MRILFAALIALVATTDQSAVDRFNYSVDQYAQLRADIEAALGAPSVFNGLEAAQASAADLARALRIARRTAAEGDIFTPEVAHLFGRTLANALVESELDAEDLLAAMQTDTEEGAWPPVVNGSFSWQLGNIMPPSILAALPPLPPDMEYRLVGPDLVLIHLRSNLIVDILREALPETTMV